MMRKEIWCCQEGAIYTSAYLLLSRAEEYFTGEKDIFRSPVHGVPELSHYRKEQARQKSHTKTSPDGERKGRLLLAARK